MKTTTYNFSVKVETKEIKGNFLNEIKNEIKDEHNQISLTRSINHETSKLHNQMLKDFVSPINKELKAAKIKFDNFEIDGNTNTNGYFKSYCTLDLPKTKMSIVLFIVGQNNREFKESKYTTFLGDKFIFEVEKINTQYDEIEYRFSKNYRQIKSQDELLEYLKNSIKNELLKSNASYNRE